MSYETEVMRAAGMQVRDVPNQISPPMNEIPSYLQQIEKAQVVLSKQLDDLEQCLGPVLSGKIGTQDAKTTAPMRESCTDLGNSLSLILARLSNCSDQVESLTRRAQL